MPLEKSLLNQSESGCPVLPSSLCRHQEKINSKSRIDSRDGAKSCFLGERQIADQFLSR